ncbi:MAG: HAMP domain-containing histidine kinase [Deltaproteobacteria bacterium]|nr:HAMP domain-containing histidine kinase [Deltaproteobacteria bacterium]
MRLKLVLVFLLTVLTPTALLVYFSLQAVIGEKEILEKNVQQKYQSIARIVAGEIQTSLQKLPEKLRTEPRIIDPILFKHTLLFQDEVMIFNRQGVAVDGIRRREHFGPPAYRSPVAGLAYEIAVYEESPVIIGELATAKEQVAKHYGIVGLSALAILVGGLFTLGELFRELRKTGIKAEFISHLVHDLRRPLTSVRMFSEMLENNRVPNEGKRKEYHRIISAESEKLVQLANNVLDFSHIEGGGRRLEMKTENLAEVVQETVRRFQSHLINETHRITPDIADSFPPVRIHAESISQALMNLLSNAVKYSPVGSEIRVALFREGNMAALSVIDHGIGIPKAERKKIFREYFRGADLEVRNREGSGLGLALVKYAVLAHRGKIRVKSEQGIGSEFKIELPVT